MNRRKVTSVRNANGEIELGPLRLAHGLGDTLTVTACAARVQNAVMLLPKEMEAFASLFDGLCPVRITDDYPEFPLCATKSVVCSNLEICGIPSHDDLPIVKVTEAEAAEAREFLEPYPNPIAFCPTSSPRADESRRKGPEFFAEIVCHLAKYATVIQFGYESFPLVPLAVRAPFKGLRKLAALYSQIGKYIGMNTGDYHLMIAVGGRCLVLDPPRGTPGYNSALWRYARPDRAQYVDLLNRTGIIKSLGFLC